MIKKYQRRRRKGERRERHIVREETPFLFPAMEPGGGLGWEKGRPPGRPLLAVTK